MSKYLFVSDIHGRNKKLEEELSLIAKNHPPKIVFFLGDIIGTDLLDQLQKLFYNGIFNNMKMLLKTNNNPSDEEILAFSTENGRNIVNGCKAMWQFLNKIDPYYFGGCCADMARELSQYVHFGHFVSNLPKTIRHSLQKDMEENAKILVSIMTNFVNVGSKVVVTEGNWDARTPLDFYATKECRSLPIEERSFYFKDFLDFMNDHVLYFDKIGIIETKNEIFIILPFDSTINYKTGDISIKPVSDKKIILVSHAQADWKPIKGETPMTSEGQKINDNMKIIIDDLRPNAIIHGHLHDQGSDYCLNKVPVKYLPIHTTRTFDFIDF